MERIGERVHQAGLADAWNPLEQHVPARQETRDRQVHDVFVADNAAPHLLSDADETLPELVDGLADGDVSHGLRMKYVWTAARRSSGTAGGAGSRPLSHAPPRMPAYTPMGGARARLSPRAS